MPGFRLRRLRASVTIDLHSTDVEVRGGTCTGVAYNYRDNVADARTWLSCAETQIVLAADLLCGTSTRGPGRPTPGC